MEKNMFFVIPEMPSKTFVMLYKKLPSTRQRKAWKRKKVKEEEGRGGGGGVVGGVGGGMREGEGGMR